MTFQENLLDTIEEEQQNKKKSPLILVITVIYLVEIIVSSFFEYIIIHRQPIRFSTLPVPLLCAILGVRLFHLITLVLFAIRKKSGWILVAFLNINAVLLYGRQIVKYILAGGHFLMMLPAFTLISQLLAFLLPLVVSVLLFLEPVTSTLNISKKTQWITVLVSVVFCSVIQLYFSK